MNGRTLDSFDRKLLRLLQVDANRTAEELGQQIGLSGSATLRRLARLKREGAILATVALIDPVMVGRPSFFIVQLEIERDRPELLGRLRRWFTDEEQVQQAFYVTGTADFVLVVTAPDVHGYEAFMNRLLAENANVRRYTTSVALSVGKRGVFVPVADD